MEHWRERISRVLLKSKPWQVWYSVGEDGSEAEIGVDRALDLMLVRNGFRTTVTSALQGVFDGPAAGEDRLTKSKISLQTRTKSSYPESFPKDDPTSTRAMRHPFDLPGVVL